MRNLDSVADGLCGGAYYQSVLPFRRFFLWKTCLAIPWNVGYGLNQQFSAFLLKKDHPLMEVILLHWGGIGMPDGSESQD